jgi:hypothetical protein
MDRIIHINIGIRANKVKKENFFKQSGVFFSDKLYQKIKNYTRKDKRKYASSKNTKIISIIKKDWDI